jgi:hypothetical protein
MSRGRNASSIKPNLLAVLKLFLFFQTLQISSYCTGAQCIDTRPPSSTALPPPRACTFSDPRIRQCAHRTWTLRISRKGLTGTAQKPFPHPASADACGQHWRMNVAHIGLCSRPASAYDRAAHKPLRASRISLHPGPAAGSAHADHARPRHAPAAGRQPAPCPSVTAGTAFQITPCPGCTKPDSRAGAWLRAAQKLW